MGFPKKTLLLISQNFDDGVSNELDVLNQRCSKHNVLSVETSKIWYLGNFSKTCSKYLSVAIYWFSQQCRLRIISSNKKRSKTFFDVCLIGDQQAPAPSPVAGYQSSSDMSMLSGQPRDRHGRGNLFFPKRGAFFRHNNESPLAHAFSPLHQNIFAVKHIHAIYHQLKRPDILQRAKERPIGVFIRQETKPQRQRHQENMTENMPPSRLEIEAQKVILTEMVSHHLRHYSFECWLWDLADSTKPTTKTRDKQHATSNEGQATSNEQRGTSNQQRATRDKQPATSNEGQATSNEQRGTSNQQRATRDKQPATSNEGQATSNEQRGTSNQQRATRDKQPATSNEGQATSNEQRGNAGQATSNEQRGTSNQQRATRDKQPATSNEGQATSNEQRGTSNQQRATRDKQHATSNEGQATSNEQRGTSNQQRATRDKQPATSNEGQATSNEQRGTSNHQRATRDKQHATSNEGQAVNNKQRGTSNQQRGTSNKQRGTSSQQQATRDNQPTTRDKQQATSNPAYNFFCNWGWFSLIFLHFTCPSHHVWFFRHC